MGPYAGFNYNLTLCPLQSPLQHMYYDNPKLASTLTLCQSRLYPPVREFGFGLCYRPWVVIEIFLQNDKDDASVCSSSYNAILLVQ